MRKPKKTTQQQLEKKLWKLCRDLADLIYVKDGKYVCFTCGKPVVGRDKQLGHFIPRSTCGAFLKYDMRNLRWQNTACNIWGGGQGGEYYRRLVAENGQEYVDQLFKDKNKVVKAYDHYVYLVGEYEKQIKEYGKK